MFPKAQYFLTEAHLSNAITQRVDSTIVEAGNSVVCIVDAVARQVIPVCGCKDGFEYLLEADIVAFDADLDP